MSVESDLKKDGIEVVEKLDTLKVNSIARNISVKLCETFPNYGLNINNLFIKLKHVALSWNSSTNSKDEFPVWIYKNEIFLDIMMDKLIFLLNVHI